MADTKITALTAITTVDPAVDVLPIVDVSDTTMAASGTTKKITSNQILGAGGTATLASATITGDLTVDTSTLKVDSANNRVGIGTATPDSLLQMAGAGTINWKLSNTSDSVTVGAYAGTTTGTTGTVSNHPFFLFTNNTERYRLASDGVATWSNVGGVAGTAMTLNSTGLGVGGSPVNFPNYTTIHAIGKTTTAGGVFQTSTSNNSTAARFACSSTGVDLFVETNHPLAFYTNAVKQMTLTAAGELLVGTTSALSSVSGSSQIALGGAGLQTTSQAISAATATTICRSGSGGVAIVAGYNGTGQYSAIVLFKYGGTATSVIGSINDTGSTITYAISGANLQITSSLALTNLTVTCIRTA